MNRMAFLVLFGSLVLGTSACTLFGSEEPMYTSGTIEENVTSVTAKVAAIDHASRTVSLLTKDGRSINFQVGPEVRNLDQVKAGDLVRVSYFESVMYQLRKPGEATPGVQVAEGGGRAQPGETPGAGVARMVSVTAIVVALETKPPSVTFQTSTGERKTIPVRDPDRLKGVKIGDLVEFTYTQALAIGVEEVNE